jgi:hypothetical protein
VLGSDPWFAKQIWLICLNFVLANDLKKDTVIEACKNDEANKQRCLDTAIFTSTALATLTLCHAQKP